MKTSLLLFLLWIPVSAVAFTTDPAVINDDSTQGEVHNTPPQISPTRTIGVEHVVNIHGRIVEIPDDFVVMATVGGRESAPSQTKPWVRPPNSVSGIQRLYQGEQVSLEEIESMELESPLVVQTESAQGNSSFHQSVITPDPLPVSRHRNEHGESPLTGFRDVGISSVSAGHALTEYRPWTKADLDPFTTPVSWRFTPGTTVGEAVRRLAAFIGYQVGEASQQVNAVYAMPLPYVHRVVRHLKVQTAFEIIGGAGMFVVVDHRKREIAHYIKALGEAESALPGCFELGFVEWESPTTGYCRVREKRCRL
ncbi:hypothetical protein AB833_13935 [Chromatiales bacterium (ex Bugula neritina AB1)]|nr:hypothetical protein AB833_13935 [Chromatiales bacterium (ex Bugula neritina AB1)]